MINNIFATFHKNNISYVIIKSRYAYDQSFPISDIDILLDTNNFCKVLNLLTSYGFKRRELNTTYPYMDFFINTKYGIMIHIHYELIFHINNKFYLLPFKQLALRNKIFDNKRNIYFISPQIEAFIQVMISIYHDTYIKNIMRQIVRKRFYTLKREKRINYLLNFKSKEKLLCKKDEIQFHNVLLILEDIITTNNYNLLSYNKLKNIIKGNILLINQKNRITDNSGIHIGVLGMDGAGKSTLVSNIYNHYSKTIESKQYYLGMYRGLDTRILNKLLNILKIRLKIDTNSFLYQVIESFRWILIAKKRLSIFNDIKKNNKQNILTVSDRYPLKDFWWMPNPMDGPRISKINSSFNLIKKLELQEKKIYESIPIPEVLICLKVNLETAYSRHTDGYENLTDKNEAISKLITNNNYSNLHIIDVDHLNQDEVANKAIEIIESYIK